MAKKLNIVTNGNKGGLPVANQGLKLSKIIALDKIEEQEQFKKLYSIDEDLLERIAEDMKSNKFDASQPVHIWHFKDEDGTEHFYLIDGYTRVKAAKIAGLQTIPYFEHDFKNFEEAHRYALHLQVDRRNLDSSDLLKNIEILMGGDYIQNMKGNKNAAIGELLGVSEKTVERANFVEKNASEEQLEAIETGEATINSTYNELKGKTKKSKKKSIEDEGAVSEALSDNSGSPSALNFSHTDGIERPEPKTNDNTVCVTLEEKNLQCETARQEGFVDGFFQAANYVLMQILHGVDTSATYINIFCNPHYHNYETLKMCDGDDPVQYYEYNEFRKSLFSERPKLKDLNPMPIQQEEKEEEESKEEIIEDEELITNNDENSDSAFDVF